MRKHAVINKDLNEVLFTGSLLECQAFLKGMFKVDSSKESLWMKCFIE